MPFSKVSEFKKAFPAVVDMPMPMMKKAMDMFNAMKKEGMEDGKAIAIAITKSKEAMKANEKENYLEYVDIIKLSEKKSIIEVLKTGKIHDRNITITESMLEDFVKNFNEGIYGTEIQVNLSHDRAGEAAGWVTKLIKEGDRLLAEVEWTPLGIEKIKSKQYKFTSSELRFEYTNPKDGSSVKNVFTGVALTNIPAVKGMSPVSLSEESTIYINNQKNMEELQELFDGLISKADLSEADVKTFAESEHYSEEGAKMLQLLNDKVESLAEMAKLKDENAKLAEEVKKTADEAKKNSTAAEKLAEEVKELSDTVRTTKLEEEVKKELCCSEDKTTGLNPSDETISKTAKFMLGLSQEQVAEFKEILASVQTVDLSTHGKTSSPESKTQGAALDSANKEAKELAEKSGRPLHECLAEVYKAKGLDEQY